MAEAVDKFLAQIGDRRDRRPESSTRRAITGGRRFSGDSLAPVMFPSTAYEVDVDDHRRLGATARPTHYYSRFGSPTVRDFEDAVAELEGAEAGLAFASGMAAVSAVVLGLCSPGDRDRRLDAAVLDHRGAVRDALPPLRHRRRARRRHRQRRPRRRLRRSPPTQLLFVETPANPMLSLVDLDAVAAIRGPIKVVDSTFATPVCQQPLRHGVDLVLHSATKGLGGHNDALLGVIAGERELIDAVWAWHSVMGAQASPFDAWNGIRGIRTLPVPRAPAVRHRPAAGPVPRGHPAVASVSYPWLESHPSTTSPAADERRRRHGHASSWPAGSTPARRSASGSSSPAWPSRSAGPRRSCRTRPRSSPTSRRPSGPRRASPTASCASPPASSTPPTSRPTSPRPWTKT